MDLGFVDGARPIAEQTDDRAGGFEAVKLAVSAKKMNNDERTS